DRSVKRTRAQFPPHVRSSAKEERKPPIHDSARQAACDPAVLLLNTRKARHERYGRNRARAGTTPARSRWRPILSLPFRFPNETSRRLLNQVCENAFNASEITRQIPQGADANVVQVAAPLSQFGNAERSRQDGIVCQAGQFFMNLLQHAQSLVLVEARSKKEQRAVCEHDPRQPGNRLVTPLVFPTGQHARRAV